MSYTLSRPLISGLSLTQGKEYHQGIAAALLTAFMWASWLISVKLGTESKLTTFDLAIARYGVPGFCFFCFTFRARKQLKHVSWPLLVGICFAPGIPFFFLGSAGMYYAPVSHAGILLPGTFPFFVTVITMVYFREPLSENRSIGLIAIGLGVVIFLLQSLNTQGKDVWKGDLFFLVASFCWATFSVCVRISGLSAFVVTGLFGSVSSIALLILYFIGVVDTGIEFSIRSEYLSYYVIQFAIQGILVGLVASISFSFAITKIGVEKTTAIGSLTPIIVIILVFFIFSEMPNYLDIVAVALVCFGVVKTNKVKLI